MDYADNLLRIALVLNTLADRYGIPVVISTHLVPEKE